MSKSLMTPSFSGRMATIDAGVRPTIRFASAPIARMFPVRRSLATTEGSLMTMPRPRTWTSVFAVPRSMPISLRGLRGRAGDRSRAARVRESGQPDRLVAIVIGDDPVHRARRRLLEHPHDRALRVRPRLEDPDVPESPRVAAGREVERVTR